MSDLNAGFRVIEALQNEIKQLFFARSEQVGRGVAQDWGDYQKRVGNIQCLEEMLDLIDATQKKVLGE